MNVDELCEHLTQIAKQTWSSGDRWQQRRRISDEHYARRIDDRLIHGQVTTVWSKVANPSALLSAMTKFITMKFAGHYASGCATGNEG